MRRGYTRADRIVQLVGVMQLGLGLGWLFTGDGPGYFLAGLAFFTLGIGSLLRPALERRAYNSGWASGRVAMVLSMSEAQARGMHPVDWLIAEAERDGFTVTMERGERD